MWTKRQKASGSDHSEENVMTLPIADPEIDPTDTFDKALGRMAWHEALQVATADEIYAGLQRALASQEWGCGPLSEPVPPIYIWLRSRGWERRYTPEHRC